VEGQGEGFLRVAADRLHHEGLRRIPDGPELAPGEAYRLRRVSTCEQDPGAQAARAGNGRCVAEGEGFIELLVLAAFQTRGNLAL
jgi:hypothetical protein